MKALRVDHKFQILERRRFIRHSLCFPLTYRTIDKKSFPVRDNQLTTVNMGLGGLMFASRQPAEVNSRILIKMPFQNRVFNVKAKVVRCEKDDKAKLYNIGASFYMLTDAFKAKLIEQLYRISEFRDLMSMQQGKEVLLEDASREWIKRYSKRFKKLYW